MLREEEKRKKNSNEDVTSDTNRRQVDPHFQDKTNIKQSWMTQN